MRFEPIEGGTGIRVLAPAKVNLYLEILGRRPDGYHEIDTLMQAVSLHDVIEFRRAPGEGLEIEVAGTDAASGLPGGAAPLVGDPERNLVIRAARAVLSWLRSQARGRQGSGLAIRLLKGVPVGGGLGGGSSDAAATLLALDRLWELELPAATLEGLAASLGSDVNFFLHGGLARCRGRGEIVTPIPEPPAGERKPDETIDYVLVTPPVEVPTALIYKNLNLPGTGRTSLTAPEPLATMRFEVIAAGIREGLVFRNRLQEAAFRLFPELRRLEELLREQPFIAVQLSGSGSTIFGVCRSRGQAEEIADRLALRLPGEFPGSRVSVAASLPSWSPGRGF